MAQTISGQTTPLTPLAPDPMNVEAKKRYVFNETGNIMMATTDSSSDLIQQSVRDVFAEVAVFFAAMTKAITSTTNPVTGQSYSIYNYTALENVIGGSGLFVQVTEEDVSYYTTSTGVQFSEDLLGAVVGLAMGSGEMAFASAMIASMGQEAINISNEKSTTDSEVGNIIFVCEYLLGMPIVSVIVVHADVSQNSNNIKAGPCFSSSSSGLTWYLHKDTYLFVTPTFIRKYAGDLASVETDPDYTSLVDFLMDAILQVPSITGVFLNNSSAPTALVTGQKYALQGEFLGSQQGTLKFIGGSATGTIAVTSWEPDEIEFTVSGTQTDAAPIGVLAPSGTTPIAQTSEQYTIAAAP